MGAGSGRLLCLQLSEQSTQVPPAEAGGGGAAALADGMAGLTVVPEASDAEAAGTDASPTAAADPASPTPTAADEATAAAIAAATAAAAAALAGPAGRPCPAGAADEEGTLSSHSLPAAGPSTPRSKGDQEMAAGQYDNGNGSGHSGSGAQAAADAQPTADAAVPAFPPDRVPPPINLTRHSSEGSGGSGGGGGGGGGARGRRSARGGTGRSSAAADPAVPGPGGAGSAGFSASLMHHIQAIRENPPQQGHGRGHVGGSSQAPQLAGWGLGEL